MMQAACTQKKLSPKSTFHMRKKGLSPKVPGTQKKKTSSPKGITFLAVLSMLQLAVLSCIDIFIAVLLLQAYNRT
jgi:hypothetical protein